MLRNSMLLLFVALIFAGSCAKKQSTVIPDKITDTVYIDKTKPVNPDIDTSYLVTGIHDLHVFPVGKYPFNIDVMQNSNQHKKITIAVSGLPNNAVPKQAEWSGYGDFRATLNLDMQFVPAGNYPIKITTMAEGAKTMAYNINLVVDSLPEKEEAYRMSFYSKVQTIQFNSSAYDSMFYFNVFNFYIHPSTGLCYLQDLPMYTDSVANNRYVSIMNMEGNIYSNSAHVKVILNSDSGTIWIPEQEVRGQRPSSPSTQPVFMVHGAGKVDAKNKRFEITYHTSSMTTALPPPVSFTVMGEFSY